MTRYVLVVLALLTASLGGCTNSVDPDRPPLYDYEPPPLGTWPEQSRPPGQRV